MRKRCCALILKNNGRITVAEAGNFYPRYSDLIFNNKKEACASFLLYHPSLFLRKLYVPTHADGNSRSYWHFQKNGGRSPQNKEETNYIPLEGIYPYWKSPFCHIVEIRVQNWQKKSWDSYFLRKKSRFSAAFSSPFMFPFPWDKTWNDCYHRYIIQWTGHSNSF